jgi:pantetheine-phosphate adenylyltransferase
MTTETPKIAIFPGSFDPFTVGHESVVRRALKMFDTIVIAIGFNTTKTEYFPLNKRIAWIKKVFTDTDRVTVQTYKGLTVDFCKSVGSLYILRGLRTAADFEYERAIAQVNKAMYPDVETVFLLTLPQHTPINSTIIREIIKQGGDASQFLPSNYNIKE